MNRLHFRCSHSQCVERRSSGQVRSGIPATQHRSDSARRLSTQPATIRRLRTIQKFAQHSKLVSRCLSRHTPGQLINYSFFFLFLSFIPFSIVGRPVSVEQATSFAKYPAKTRRTQFQWKYPDDRHLPFSSVTHVFSQSKYRVHNTFSLKQGKFPKMDYQVPAATGRWLWTGEMSWRSRRLLLLPFWFISILPSSFVER